MGIEASPRVFVHTYKAISMKTKTMKLLKVILVAAVVTMAKCLTVYIDLLPNDSSWAFPLSP